MEVAKMTSTLFESNLTHLPLIQRGKVRDIYDIDEQHMLIVATDRLSAFDVILPTPIPDKGQILTQVSNFWFNFTQNIVPNHLTTRTLGTILTDALEYQALKDRAVIVKKFKPLPIEAIVRGYIIGSGWKDYQKTGAICGIQLPDNLQQAEKLPHAIYTPSTKAAVGEHDENIDFAKTVELVGQDLAEKVRDISLQIYQQASEYALQHGIIIADTKLEFGIDEDNNIVLIDEVLTPDSSRFWDVNTYQIGTSPASFDKQFVRDYLETLNWDKTPPAPILPKEIITKTTAKYREAQERLLQK